MHEDECSNKPNKTTMWEGNFGVGRQENIKKFSNFNSKNKDCDANAIMGPPQAPVTQVPYYPYPYVSTVIFGSYPPQGLPMPLPQQPFGIPLQNQHQQQNAYLPRNHLRLRTNYERKTLQIDPLSMPYSQILPYLIHRGWVTPKALSPPITPPPPGFNINAKCEYHGGSPDHTTGNCKALKYKVQELMNDKLLTFKKIGPNVKNNIMLGHAGPVVNAIEECPEIETIKDVERIKIHILIIHDKLTEVGITQEVHGFCEVCLSSPEECEELKQCLQELINQGRCR